MKIIFKYAKSVMPSLERELYVRHQLGTFLSAWLLEMATCEGAIEILMKEEEIGLVIYSESMELNQKLVTAFQSFKIMY